MGAMRRVSIPSSGNRLSGVDHLDPRGRSAEHVSIPSSGNRLSGAEEAMKTDPAFTMLVSIPSSGNRLSGAE